MVAEYARDGRRLIGAYAPVAPWGMGALVDKTVDAALLPVNRITCATLLWIAVSALIGFDRGADLRPAAQRPGRGAGRPARARSRPGKLETRIAAEARATSSASWPAAFNQMAVGARRRAQKITQQTDEIMAWNQTLEKRVEEKTAELRQAQDLLFRSRSLSALGELGAGVAHEINNPLTGALGIVQLLIADLPAGHPARPLLQDLENEALRIRKIVQNMLRLAQRQSGHDTTPVDLARTLDDAVELCGPSDLAAAGIEVVRRYAATPPVRGSATQLQESFIQLIQNARSAMKKGGTLTLETEPHRGQGRARPRSATPAPASAPEHLPRIFDPFFTTKGRPLGDRAGAVVRAPHRRGPRRHDHGREQRRRRHHVHPHLPRRRRAGPPAMSTRPAQPQARHRRARGWSGLRRARRRRGRLAPALRAPRPPARLPPRSTAAAAVARRAAPTTATLPGRRRRPAPSRPSATGGGSPIKNGDTLTRNDVVRTAPRARAPCCACRPGPRSSCASGWRSGSIGWRGGATVDLRRGKVVARVQRQPTRWRSPRARRAPPTRARRTSWCSPTSAAGCRWRRSRARRSSPPAASRSPSPRGRSRRARPGAAPERSRAHPRGGPAGGGLAGRRAAARRARPRCTGRAAPSSAVTVNGAPAPVGADGHFTATVPLRTGKNTVDVEAEDLSGPDAADVGHAGAPRPRRPALTPEATDLWKK